MWTPCRPPTDEGAKSFVKVLERIAAVIASKVDRLKKTGPRDQHRRLIHMIEGQQHHQGCKPYLAGKGTGSVRVQRRFYVDSLTPCIPPAPAGENIQAWLALAQAAGSRKHGSGWWRITRSLVHGVCATTRASRTVTAGNRRSGTHPRG